MQIQVHACIGSFVKCSTSRPEQTFDFQSLRISATSASAARAEELLVFHQVAHPQVPLSPSAAHTPPPPLLLLTTATKLD